MMSNDAQKIDRSLFYAAGRGDYPTVKLLLQQGAEVNEAHGPIRWTPLHNAANAGKAAQEGCLQIVRILLQKGCELAVANGHRAAGIRALGLKDYGFNCNILGDDPGHLGLGVNGQQSKYGQAEGKLSCDGRLALMKKMQIDFSAAERWLWPQEICIEKFIYMTCFRDPISRIKSSLRFHRLQQPKVVMSWAESHSFNPASPISNGSPTVDNFYIRTFSGKSVYTKHLGQITTSDLERAKNILSLFEVVIILEKLSTRDVVQLATRLQWSKTSLSFTPKKTGRTTVRALSSEQERHLRQLNALDQEFYQHADRQAAEISSKCSQNALKI